MSFTKFTKLVYSSQRKYEVTLSEAAQRDLERVPDHIETKLEGWIKLVKREGLPAAQKIPGYRDEALKGTRTGQRSIRLNRAYRAIYRLIEETVILVYVEEVNKHDY